MAVNTLATSHEGQYWLFAKLFFKWKSDVKNAMLPLGKDLKATYGIDVMYARCDNAGENDDFEWACKQQWMGI